MNTLRTLSRRLAALVLIAALLTTGCNLPVALNPNRAPGSAGEPLPPALVEAVPPDGSQIGLIEPITLYFNQPMNRASVEGALNLQPPGKLTWADDSTLIFIPAQPYPPANEFSVYLGGSARARNGLNLSEPVSLTYRTADYLRPVQVLPEDGSQDVPATAAIAVIFNQPVVPLGADPSTLPAAFSLFPATTGRGEWLNTSTCVFYPDPPLAGDTEYSIVLNPGLSAASGSPLAPELRGRPWRFTTAPPRLVSVRPLTGEPLELDQTFTLTFNQPMDPASVTGSLVLSGPGGIVEVRPAWNEDNTVLTIQPIGLLERGQTYTLILGADAAGRSGTRIGFEQRLAFRSYPALSVTKIEYKYGRINLTLSAPLAEQDLRALITIQPAVANATYRLAESRTYLMISGDFDYDTTYRVFVSAALTDRWGGTMSAPYTGQFATIPATPSLELPYGYFGLPRFIRATQPQLTLNATNVRTINLALSPLSMEEFQGLTGPNSYEYRKTFQPTGTRRATRTVNLPANRARTVTLDLPAGGELTPGFYYLSVDSPQVTSSYYSGSSMLLIASEINVTMKVGPEEILVWAVDLRTMKPLAGAPVTIYAMDGSLLTEGVTDGNGLWREALYDQDKYDRRPKFALIHQPGHPDFGLGYTGWEYGIQPFDFGYSGWSRGRYLKIYLYSDRPIYRPGQTVYYRGVAREAFDAAYSLPDLQTVAATLESWDGKEWGRQTLPVSEYGTFHGEFALPEDLPPGYYTLRINDDSAWLSIPVAAYRKPEFALDVDLQPDAIRSGGALTAQVEARYYFDAPVNDLDLRWSLYRQDAYFSIPGYRTGVHRMRTSWYEPYDYMNEVESGEARTDAEGRLELSLPAVTAESNPQQLTLELTGQDESGFPVSARATALVHPADFYIGLRADSWIGQAGTPLGFEVLTVDWERAPRGGKALRAEFLRVTWQQQDGQWTPVYAALSSSNLVTGPDGKARLQFTPEAAGTYMLDVAGDGARSQVMVWVAGPNVAAWPRPGQNRIELAADQSEYQPGQTARIFIPNPFSTPALALVGVERGTIQQISTLTLSGGGSIFELPLTDRHAPNVYVSVTILGPEDDYRQGLLNLTVAPVASELRVELAAEPQRAGPGQTVTLDLRVRDSSGRPVQGEFSLAVADLAALALADPNSTDILSAFYSTQPLEISTSLSLNGSVLPEAYGRGGGGGGGGEEVPVREDFPDTAYWTATLVTGPDGRGRVTFTLPDTLTTWRMDARGVTADTRVGQATFDIISTKDLLIRPVTPRFLVAGDHIELAAVVNNNTDKKLNVDVSLQASGVLLDSPARATQRVQVPARGRVRVAWWGTVEAVEGADLVFSASAGDLRDATRPVWGTLPVLRYAAPQAFVTAGVLSEAGSRTELISLPRSFDPAGGGLQVELTPSLAAALLTGLEHLQPPPAYASVEWQLSYLLPHLEIHRTLASAGLDQPALRALVESRLPSTLQALADQQNDDGGWSWQPGMKSDAYITTYVLFGLARIREAGQAVDERMVSDARKYLISQRPYLGGASLEDGELDRLAYVEYVLSLNGGAEGVALETLHASRDRLSPWAQALLALSLESARPGDPAAADILSALQTSALRSASGAHWQTTGRDWRNPGTPLFTTAVVAFALAQRDPASPTLADAVRYLAAQRDAAGRWGSGYESAWVLLALTEAMRGSGELQADFAFSAALNRTDLAAGQARAPESLTPVLGSVSIDSLDPRAPNRLIITRSAGSGRLYYRAVLTVFQPVETIQPLNRGLSVAREYRAYRCARDCPPTETVRLQDRLFVARLTLTVPHDAYYVVIEDYIPAGSEIVNRGLKTSQQLGILEEEVLYDPDDPLADGWGWWWFDAARIHDDHIRWSADYLPAGTYVLTYTLVPTQAGEFRVLPPRAWLEYFPEVQGRGAGQVLAIQP